MASGYVEHSGFFNRLVDKIQHVFVAELGREVEI